jgi:hypothetical protein
MPGRGRPRRQQPVVVHRAEEETDTDDEDYEQRDDGDPPSDWDPDDLNVADLVLHDIERPKKLNIVSKHLSENYFSMAKDLNKDMECSICLSNIDCKNCFTLLSCGHSFHAGCLLFLKEKICPVCRDHTH